jgi:hypothetical protein
MTKAEVFLSELIAGLVRPTPHMVVTQLRLYSFSPDDEIADLAFDALQIAKKKFR